MICTAKRLGNLAQGCRAARLPWVTDRTVSTPTGLRQLLDEVIVLSLCSIYAGEKQPRWGCATATIRSQGSRAARQPWAKLYNRFAVFEGSDIDLLKCDPLLRGARVV